MNIAAHKPTRPHRPRRHLHTCTLSAAVASALVTVMSWQPSAHAEGSAELGARQRLQVNTVAYVDILDADNECIAWTGTGTMAVTAPDGTLIATLASGDRVAPTAGLPGAYELRFSTTQTFTGWDIAVLGSSCAGAGAAQPGRLYSLDWKFSAGSFGAEAASDGSFFALVPGGSPTTDAVVELDLNGMAGHGYSINSNATGVDGAQAGKSVPVAGNAVTPYYPMYLNPPAIARYGTLTPVVTGFAFRGGPTGCNAVVPGVSTGQFEFDSNVAGTYNLVCDLDRDTVYDRTDPDDLLIVGTVSAGANAVPWNGTDNSGAPVPDGSYDCVVYVNVGEFHFVGNDIETSFEGMRIFSVAANGVRTGLKMYWDDSLIAADAEPMPNGEMSLTASGVNGLSAGNPADPADANVNARAWGNFDGDGKGNESFLDTYAAVKTTVSTSASVDALSLAVDDDFDGLATFDESCSIGTDPFDPDTDADGIDDFVETDGGFRTDTDGDGTIDALDDDSDDDGLFDQVEGVVDPDFDMIGNWRDQDDDGDGIDTATELADGLALGNSDPDGDGDDSWYDVDSDGDGIADSSEGEVDTDSDSAPDYLDLDSDGDGVTDDVDTDRTQASRCGDSDGDTCDDCAVGGVFAPASDGDDFDSDGLCDLGDADDDNDDVVDASDSDPLNRFACRDSDADSCDDCSVTGASAPAMDGLDTDSDGTCDAGDDDDDGDTVIDALDSDPLDRLRCRDSDADLCDDCAIEGAPAPHNDGYDPDLDGLCNAGDPDDDGDTVPDALDRDPANPLVCRDADADTCDDCAMTGSPQPANDGLDTDGDGICDAGEVDADGDGVADDLDSDPRNRFVCGDADRDGCEDCLSGRSEPRNDGPDLDSDGLCDAGDRDDDGDGMSDVDEARVGTDPRDGDSDDDGLADGAEPGATTDTDGDGLINALDVDSDGDGIFDGTEVGLTSPHPDTDLSVGAFVADADPSTTTDPTRADSDGGGVDDGAEDPNHDGAISAGDTDPNNSSDDTTPTDSDGDGLSDAEEHAAGTDPHDADSDDDGVLDGREPNWSSDTDGDGLINARDPDADDDGLLDGTELGLTEPDADTDVGAGAFVADADPRRTTNPLLRDSDGGGVADGTEDTNKNGARDPGETDPTVAADDAPPVDTDGDGLSDAEETRFGTSPTDADSDDDGVIDGDEPNWNHDTDGDGAINALDADADGDGLRDGTELGLTAPAPGTDLGAGNFRADSDPTTTTSPVDRDSDNGGVPDGDEDTNRNGRVDGAETDPNRAADDGRIDTDGDGIADLDEGTGDHDGDGIPDYLDTDADGDGISDRIEAGDDDLSTPPVDTDGDGTPDYLDTDSDDDGASDAFEAELGTNRLDRDSDDDGIIDGQEPAPAADSDGDGLGNALDADSDNDGLFDGTEVGLTLPDRGTDLLAGTFVADADPASTTDPLTADSDGGGVADGAEDANHDGAVDSHETDPNDPNDDVPPEDSDGDGLSDAEELAAGSDPRDGDSDDDGVIDGQEPNWNQDTDGDGAINVLDPDSDDDLVFDGTERGVTVPSADTNLAAGYFVSDRHASTTTSAVRADTDGGGVTDGDEDVNRNGRVDAGERDPNDASDDQPSDPDGEEPVETPDADGDGIEDDVDNCVDVANPDQSDRDRNGVGDACDAGDESSADSDADGVPDALDNCPSADNGAQQDLDGDGLGDICDDDANGDGYHDRFGVTGGGCSTGGSEPSSLAVALALALLVLRSRRSAAIAAAALLVMALATPAKAQQSDAFSVERFRLAMDRDGVLDVEWAAVPEHLHWNLGLWLGTANDPLVLYDGSAGERVRAGALVGQRTTASLVGAVALWDRLQLGLELPVVLSQGSDDIAGAPMNELSGGFGDLRLVSKVQFLRQQRHRADLALIVGVTAPLGSASDFRGDGVSLAPELAIGRRFGAVRTAVNLGYRLRRQRQLIDLTVDDELFWHLGVGYRFEDRGGPPIELSASLAGATEADRLWRRFNRNHLELLAGASYAIDASVTAFIAGGLGADEGYGTPDWRALAGVRWQRKPAAARAPSAEPVIAGAASATPK